MVTNNQWAISVPRESQSHAQTLAQKAIAAGIDCLQVDGNDLLAVEYASRKALERAGWTVDDLDLVEANEAFAAQAIAVNRDMGWDPEIVNVNGGAIAIGHPIGASGARVLVTLLHEMEKRDAKKGLTTLCIGGGMGIAMCIERN